MTSVERKIVHLLLKERADVETSSDGREPFRHIVVSPAGAAAAESDADADTDAGADPLSRARASVGEFGSSSQPAGFPGCENQARLRRHPRRPRTCDAGH